MNANSSEEYKTAREDNEESLRISEILLAV